MTVRAISYGGGVQSTAMLVLAAQERIDFRLAIFSNVGNDSEHPETIEYFNNVAKPYAAQHGIELVELKKTGKGKEQTLWEKLIKEDSRSIGIPVRMSDSGAPGRRNCTVEFKIKRVASELKRRGATPQNPAVVALGISLEEYQRMRTSSGIPYQTLAYPLIDLRIDRAGCEQIIAKAGLPVPPKSSCFFCPYHTIAYWKKMKQTHPELFEKSVLLEETLNQRRQQLNRDPVWFTNKLMPLRLVVGDNVQMDLFKDEAPGCDIGGYCMS